MKSTKKALLLSITSMLLCVAMLMGTTFAWFTDSVTSGTNRIVAGNLDVDMLYKSGNMTEYKTVNGVTNTADGSTPFFVDKNGGKILWEPGVMVYTYFDVKNLGTLALQYNFALRITEKNALMTGGVKHSLDEVIKAVVLPGEVAGNQVKSSVEGQEWKSIESFTDADSLQPNGNKKFTVVLYWAPTANDDLYNVKNGQVTTNVGSWENHNAKALYIDFDIRLTATQLDHENDSFDNTYDKVADLWKLSTVTPDGRWVGITKGESCILDGTLDPYITVVGADGQPGEIIALTDGLDKSVGNGKITVSGNNVTYTNSGAAQEVVIRSNGGTVSVEAPLDQVKHYGSATEVKITSVSQTSYYEYGKTTFVDIKNGRLVITNDKEAEVGTIYLSATSDAYNNITLATMSGAELPAVVQREAVTITSEKKLVATVQQVSDTGVEDTSKTEHIYLYAASTAYENTKGYSNVSDLGELVLEAPTGVSSFEITLENGNKETVTVSSLPDEVKETKTSTASEAKQGAQSRAICVDEENKIYELATADDLKLFASLVNGGQNFAGCTVKLTADIDLNNEDWTPIGNSATNYFAGVFDGQGHEIKNLKIVGHHHLGLFGYASGNDYDYSRDDVYNQTTNIFSETPITESHFTCVIKNFTIKNAKVEANDALKSNGAIKDTRSHSGIVLGEGGCVYVSNISIKSGSIKGQKYYGGVVGIIQKGVIKNCSLDADSSVTAQTGEYGHAGGILGAVLMSSTSEVLSFYSSNTEASNCHVTIYDCTNDANITLNYGFAAGIISLSNGSNTLVYNCTNNGKISVSAGSTAMQIGGVFGNSQSRAVIVNCTNNGDVTGSSTHASQNHVAGICSNWANIINCVNNGEISGSSLYMAGICAVASSGAQLYGCTNNGTISNTSTMAGAKTSDLTTTGANKMSFASLGELQAHIDALTGSESLEVTNTTALSGTLKLNKFITTLKSNVKICDTLDIDDIGNYCNINIPNASITISGDRSSANYTFSGNGTSITLASDVTLKHLSLNAAKDTAITFINNGTVSTRIDMNGLGTINVTNNGTLNSGISMWGTGTANITNNAGATITSGWHSVHTEAACTMNVYNHGTIATTGQGSCFAMLFYNGCTVDAYMYDGSDVKGGNILAPYSANKVTLHYESGAKINGTAGAWAGRSDSKTTYTTNMD